MRIDSGVRAYAKALYEIAEEKGLVDEVLGQLQFLSEVVRSSAELQSVLRSEVIDAPSKLTLIESFKQELGWSPLIQQLLNLLASKSRLDQLPSLTSCFSDLVDQKNGMIRGVVRTAAPLAETDRKDLEKSLEKKFSRTVLLNSEVDATLLGGLTVQIGDLVFDGSLRTSLNRLKASFERY